MPAPKLGSEGQVLFGSNSGLLFRNIANVLPPSTGETGAAISVARAIPELKGKFDGLSFRVPNITGSISDITFIAKRPTTVEEIAKILEDAAASPRWQGILKVTRDQLVSSDNRGDHWSIVVKKMK